MQTLPALTSWIKQSKDQGPLVTFCWKNCLNYWRLFWHQLLTMINTNSHTLKHERNTNEISTSISQNHFSVIWKLFSLHSSLHFHNLQSYSIDYTSFAREDFRLGSGYNTSSSCKEKAAQGIMYSDLPPRPSWLTIRLFCVCDVRILFWPSWHMMAEPHYRTHAESWRATIIVYLNTLKCLQIWDNQRIVHSIWLCRENTCSHWRSQWRKKTVANMKRYKIT